MARDYFIQFTCRHRRRIHFSPAWWDQLIIHFAILQQRFVPFISFDWLHILKTFGVFYFMCDGRVATHVFIDAFTHQDGFMTRPVSFFHSQKPLLFAAGLLFLQLLSRCAGAGYMLWFVLRLPERNPACVLIAGRFNTGWYSLLQFPAVLLIRFTITKSQHIKLKISLQGNRSLVYALLLLSLFNFRKSSRQADDYLKFLSPGKFFTAFIVGALKTTICLRIHADGAFVVIVLPPMVFIIPCRKRRCLF